MFSSKPRTGGVLNYNFMPYVLNYNFMPGLTYIDNRGRIQSHKDKPVKRKKKHLIAGEILREFLKRVRDGGSRMV